VWSRSEQERVVFRGCWKAPAPSPTRGACGQSSSADIERFFAAAEGGDQIVEAGELGALVLGMEQG
jgi:hypothetical protein